MSARSFSACVSADAFPHASRQAPHRYQHLGHQRDTGLSRYNTAVFDESWRSEWRGTLGPWWPALLAFYLVCLFIGGFTTPLSDADLPMHLALGEWIVRHRAVPFVEPFAWTRAGAPFFAYSWLLELVYYRLLEWLGPNALQALHGVVLALAGAAVIALGAALRWSGWTTLMMIALHIVIGVGTVPTLRPQGIFLVLVPLAWTCAVLAASASRAAWPVVGLFACSVIAANSHLFFPLVAAPGVVLLSRPTIDWKRVGLVALAIGGGWLVSPYGLHWAEVLRLNFEPHALYTSPTPVDEYTPGFSALRTGGGTGLLLVPLLLALPWLTASKLAPRERTLHGVLWVGGLVTFAVAIRGLLPWWLATRPLTAAALGSLAAPVSAVVLTTQRAIVTAIFGAMALLGGGANGDPSLEADALPGRRLPSSAAAGIEPIARWLDCHLRPASSGRLLTVFNFGSYARWRLPTLSESIDGRTIFPDSVAAAETYVLPVRRALPLPPWRSADVAIVPISYPVAAVLDTAAGWRRVAITADVNGPAAIIGLWVRTEWWGSAGRDTLPAQTARLFHRPSRHEACAPTGGA